MFELTSLTDKTYYIESPAKIGVWCPDGVHAWFIDSGNDKDAGRKLRKILDQQGWQLQGIFNTHSNADHIGGNQYLQRQTGCRVYAGGLEKAFTSYPILEPSFLYGLTSVTPLIISPDILPIFRLVYLTTSLN